MAKRTIAFRPSDYAETLEIARAFFAPCAISQPAPQVGDDWHLDIDGDHVPDGASPARFVVERTVNGDGSVTRTCRIVAIA